MNADTLTRVRKLRAAAPWMGLKDALSAARYETASPRYAFLNGMDAYPSAGDKVTGSINGIDVTVSIIADEDSQLGDDDVTGTFTNTNEPGCIMNSRSGWNGRDYKWYKPAHSRLSDTVDGGGWRWYNRYLGMSKQVAREYNAALIRSDMRDDNDRSYYGVAVSLTVDGDEIGSDSLWGIDVIDSSEGRHYLIDTAADLIDEALSEVPGNIGRAIDSATSRRDALIAIRDNLGDA